MDKRVRLYIALLMIFSVSLPLFAQGDDWNSWLTMKVSHGFTRDFTLSGIVEYRTKSNFSAADRWGVALNGEYRILPFLKAEVGYEVHHRNKGADGWEFRQRYMIGATLSAKWSVLKFSLRERFQQTFDQGTVETNLRSRAKVNILFSKTVFSPYFSIELYQQIAHQSFWKVDRLRYRPGVDIALPKGWGLDVFYCFQHEPDKSKNIVGVDCSFTF